MKAVISGYGSAITDNKHTTDCMLNITATDARVILQPHNEGFIRTVWVTVHVKCLDSSRKIIFASGRNELFEDKLSTRFLGLTDDSTHFCGAVRRIILKKDSGKVLLFSALILTGILSYFAFQ